MGNHFSITSKENDTVTSWALRIYFAGALSVGSHLIWEGFWNERKNDGVPNEINAVIRGLLWPVLYIPPVIIDQYKKYLK